MTDRLEELWARERMREVILHYCRGVDRRDWALVRSCFTADAAHQHVDFTWSTDEFVGFAEAVLQTMSSTLHTINGVVFNIGDDTAESEAAFVAYHHIRGECDGRAPVPTGGVDTDWIVAGRYVDRWRRVDGLWKIARRHAFHDWTRAGPTTPK